LAKEKMKQVMEEIWREFPGHQVIIDSPPVLSTPDPMVLARQVDGVLMVVRAGKTPRDFLMKALQSLNSSKLMGVVLNGAELGMSSKYYYYSSTGNN
jgi:Mrp family chromosome partitioning ATPase